MDKKVNVGIVTYYYNTHNYGGILQAYALTKFLRDKGFNAEQICCTHDGERPFEKIQENKQLKKSWISRITKSIKYRIGRYIFRKKIVPFFSDRNEKFRIFEEQIPHSEKVYSLDTINSSNKYYTHFITGSDQIWTFRWFNPIYFLEFADVGKKKISYAASMGKSKFTIKEKTYLKKVLTGLDAISVREHDLVNELQNITGCAVDLVVDPTFLLCQKEWEEIVSKNIIEEDYLFCYFLGDDPQLRKLAKQFAKRVKVKLVTIPFANEVYNSTDFFFGNKKVYTAGPEDFLSLIKGAKYVFTDSFHATVFSIIFKKEFLVFSRADAIKMSSRLYSLTELYDCKERFLTQQEDMKIDNIFEIMQNKLNIEMKRGNDLREKSINYLVRNLK